MGSVEEGGSVREAWFNLFFFLLFFVKENIPRDNDNVFRCVKHKQNIIMGSVEEGRSVREVWYKHLKTKVKLIWVSQKSVREVWFKYFYIYKLLLMIADQETMTEHFSPK